MRTRGGKKSEIFAEVINGSPLIYRLIDSLDTLAVLGNYSEFRRVYQHIADTSTFDADINVSVFETNIREGY